MRNKKTQKQGRSKRGGVAWQLLAAPFMFAAQIMSASRASQSLTTTSPYSELKLLSSAELKDIIDNIPMTDTQQSTLNTKLPVYNFITDNDGNQVEIPGFLKQIGASDRILWFPDITPEIADIIYYFGKSVNIYEGPISVRQGIEPLVFPGNIVFVNQDGTVPDLFGGRKGGLIPISNYVPEGTTIDDMKKTIGEGFEKNSFSQNGLLAIKHLKNPNIEYLEGGSRKKRPKTKRRSKRY